MSLKLKIMMKAVKIRMEKGEELEAILASYPRLTEEEKAQLRSAVQPGGLA